MHLVNVPMIPKADVHQRDGVGEAYCGTTPRPFSQYLTNEWDEVTCRPCLESMNHDAQN